MKKYITSIEECQKNKEVSFYLNNKNIEFLPKELFSLTHLKILDV